MKVLITGGGGFIGNRLAQELLKQGTLADAEGKPTALSQITLLDIGFPQAKDPRLTYIEGDLTDPLLLAKAMGKDTSTVFHLASIVSGGAEADFDLGLRVNLNGTRSLLEACRQQHCPPRFLFASSVAAFGKFFPPVVEDSTTPRPVTSYGTQKVCCEYLIDDYTRKGFLDGRVLRLPTISVRPGKPNQAKSSYASGIIREPLNGIVSHCPVKADTGIWILSPGKIINALIHAHDLPGTAWGTNRVLNLPGMTATAGEMVDALRKVAGESVANRVDWVADADIQAFIDSLPQRFKTTRALEMGFVADDSVESIIRDYINDQGITL